ncbi:fibronectin type III domain-containing protein [Flavobacterium gelidilacus]
MIVLLIVSWQMNAQFGCTSAVVLTNGFTATGITTPGNAGPEDWNDNPTDTAPTSGFYWDDDVYTYTYTSGSNPEEISMTIFSVNSWNGIGIFANCSGTVLSGHITSVGLTGANTSKTVTANIAANQTVYIAIGQWGTPNGLNFNVTSFTATPLVNPPACVVLSSPANMAVNVSSSNISWPAAAGAATNYAISVGTTSGGTDVLNNVSVGNVLTYNLGVLSSATTYYVTVTPSNSNGSATSCAETSFTTCGEVTAFFENFDSYTSTGTTSAMQNCWSKGGNGNTYVTTGALAPMSPSNRLYMFASGTTPTEGYAILPAVSNLQANTHRLKFKAFSSSGTNRFLVVGYLTDPADVTTFVQLEEITIPGTVVGNTQEIVVIPTGIPVGVKYLSIKNSGFPGGSTTAYLDDVAWEAIPACSNPTNVSATAVTSSGATINWTGNASDVSWEIEYGAPGFTIGTGTTVAASTNPFTLSGLMPQTSYQFYVRAICAGPSTSTNSLSGSFLTSCVPISTFPWNENFDSLTGTLGTTNFPPCWLKENGDWASANATTYNTANSGSNYLRDSWSATNEFIWTGGFNLVAGTSYDFSSFIQGDGFTGWTVDYLYNTSQSSTGATQLGSTYAVPGTGTIAIQPYAKVTRTFVPTTSGVYYFALRVNQPSFSPWYVAFDDFELKITPTVLPSCSTNLVATPNSCGNFANQLSWDSNALASGYFITIGTTSGGTDIANNVDISNNSYSFVGQINTQYFWKVVPYNGTGSATGCVEQNFTTSSTGCYCPSVPTVLDNSGITNVQLGSTDFPTNVVTYFDHSATQVTLPQGLNTNVQISFATGYTYNTYIWIDLNDNYIFDASELVYTGESLSANPTVLNASFVMPATAAIGVHKMRIVTADALATADPCYSGSYGVTLDFSVNIIVSSCTPASATATIVPDCTNNQYSVNVDVTNLGSGSPVLSYGTTTLPITATGVVTAGPFTSGSSNTLTILHGSDITCDLPLGNFTYACPPVNDECANPTVLTPGGIFATNQVTGTNVAATSSTQTAPTCASYQGGDVWYSAVVPASGSLTFEVNPTTGGLTDTGGSVYSGTCSSLTEIACNDSSSASGDHPLIIVTGQTPGSVLYFRVWEYGNDVFGTFLVSAYDGSLSTSSFDNASFVAYPNPVVDVLNLSYSSEITSVKVINLLGQEVISRKVNNTTSQIDMTSLTAGAYIVNVTVGDVVKTIKVIKQ